MSIRAYLGIGSNLGDRPANLQLAVEGLAAESGTRVVAVSPVYETISIGGPPQDDFLNAVVAVDTELTPQELLGVARSLEERAHRVREERWGPRTLDVDILTYGRREVAEPDLVIPHPRMAERAFVLAPLHDLDPEAAPVPATGWSGVRRAGVELRVPPTSPDP